MTFKYRIEGGRYGGEVVVGRIEEELFERLKDLEEDELWEALWELEDETGVGWYEYDDFEHLNGAYSDGGFTVVDITEADDPYDWNESEQYLDPYHIYDREAFSTSTMNPGNAFPAGNEETIPVIAVHSAEKGSFGVWFLETEEVFDPDKLSFSSVATDVCEVVENVYYDRVALESDFDYADTNGKGMYCAVGRFVEKWHDKQFTEEQIAERFQEVMDD